MRRGVDEWRAVQVVAVLVCADIERAGRTPVWSTSEANVASRRVAAKLGFVETSRRVYVNRR